jgi:hypothetical protein
MKQCLINGLSASADMTTAFNSWWSQVVDVTNARTVGLGLAYSNFTASATSPTLTITVNFSSKDNGQLYRLTGASSAVEVPKSIVSVVSALSTGNWRLWAWPAIADQFRLRVTSDLVSRTRNRIRLKNWELFLTT